MDKDDLSPEEKAVTELFLVSFGKKAETKRINVVEIDIDISPTSVEKSKLDILSKNFPYQELMDQVLMAPTWLEQFHEDEDDLVEKL